MGYYLLKNKLKLAVKNYYIILNIKNSYLKDFY